MLEIKNLNNTKNQYWICLNCKRANIAIAKFCGKCGKPHLNQSQYKNNITTDNLSKSDPNYSNQNNKTISDTNFPQFSFPSKNSLQSNKVISDVSLELTNKVDINNTSQVSTIINQNNNKNDLIQNISTNNFSIINKVRNFYLTIKIKSFKFINYFYSNNIFKNKLKIFLQTIKIFGFIVFISIFLNSSSFTFEKVNFYNEFSKQSTNQITEQSSDINNINNKISIINNHNYQNLDDYSSKYINNSHISSSLNQEDLSDIKFLVEYVTPTDSKNSKVVINYSKQELCWNLDFIGIKVPPVVTFPEEYKNKNMTNIIQSIRLDKIHNNPNIFRLSIYTHSSSKLTAKQLKNFLLCKLEFDNSMNVNERTIQHDQSSQPLLSPSALENNSSSPLVIDIQNGSPTELLLNLAKSANINLSISSNKLKQIEKISVKSNYNSAHEAIVAIANKLKLKVEKVDDRNWIIN